MTKEQILARCDELDAEAIELRAENDAIQHTLSLIVSDGTSKMDETLHELNRRQNALNIRVAKWQHEIDELAKAAARLAA